MASYKNGSITLENVYGKKTYETTIVECGSSIELQELTITQNGTYTAPDEVGYSPINVNVPSKEEETKSITITENGTTTVLPTSGKTLSKVDIVANVQSSGEDNPLQYVIDNQGGDGKPSCFHLFGAYKGSSLDNAINKINTGSCTDMSYMFDNCNNLITIPQFDTSSCTNMSYMFQGCNKLTTISQLDTSKVTDMTCMFNSCNNLTAIPQLDTSHVYTMYYMFNYCSLLTTIPQLNTSSCTNMEKMFQGCSNLTTIPQLDTSKVTDMRNMFYECRNLTTIPQLNTSKVTTMYYMFCECRNLTTIPQLNMSNVTNTKAMFYGCSALTYLKLINVKENLQIGSGTDWGHLIEKDCLIQIISELIKPSSGTKTLTMGTANKEKIADTYVKLLADDGTGKYPFEVCASTDEGAMTIEAYCNSKNWNLA